MGWEVFFFLLKMFYEEQWISDQWPSMIFTNCWCCSSFLFKIQIHYLIHEILGAWTIEWHGFTSTSRYISTGKLQPTTGSNGDGRSTWDHIMFGQHGEVSRFYTFFQPISAFRATIWSWNIPHQSMKWFCTSLHNILDVFRVQTWKSNNSSYI